MLSMLAAQRCHPRGRPGTGTASHRDSTVTRKGRCEAQEKAVLCLLGRGVLMAERTRSALALGAIFAALVSARPAQAQTFTVLHKFKFTGGMDGGYPTAGVIRDSAGNLYGTAGSGGGPTDSGIVFRLDPSGKETVLHSFSGPDGAAPYAGLTRDAAGNLYGTTYYGGAGGKGTVFKIDAAGTESVLYSLGAY